MNISRLFCDGRKVFGGLNKNRADILPRLRLKRVRGLAKSFDAVIAHLQGSPRDRCKANAVAAGDRVGARIQEHVR